MRLDSKQHVNLMLVLEGKSGDHHSRYDTLSEDSGNVMAVHAVAVEIF